MQALGLGEEISSAIGGMAGAIGSAIALPIGWAVGDAVLAALPRAMEHFADTRYQTSLGARTGGGLVGRELTDRAGVVRAILGHYYTTDSKGNSVSLRDQAVDTMIAFQGAGPPSANQTLEAERNARVTLALERLAIIPAIESDPSGTAATFRKAFYGTRGERAAAMQELGQKEYIFRPLVDEMIGERKAEGRPVSEWTAEMEVRNRLGYIPGTTGAYDPDKLLYYAELRSRTDKRILGEFEKQDKEWRSVPDQGLMSTIFGAEETKLNARERAYFHAMQNIRKREDQLRKEGKDPHDAYDKFDRWLAETRAKAPSFELVQDAGDFGLGRFRRWLFNVKPDAPLSDEQMKRLEDAASGTVGHPRELPFSKPDKAADMWLLSQYHWTSFSGLAEQMQQMWTGAPQDAMVGLDNSLQDLTAAVQANTAAQQGYGSAEEAGAAMGKAAGVVP